ncbi:MAG: cysteine peptidase family C39 domain-containing protein [Dehalococcoidia bacterium]|nr:cysteine peptidase family C39 domain-containing protein [Dehalococcoidia bacterium]
MINLRNTRQTFDFDCGAKALQTVMEYYGVEMRGDEVLKELNSDRSGTNPVNMIALAEKKGFQVFASANVPLEELKRFVDEGYPVIVLLQAWAERYMTLEDWRSDFEDGHYAIAIGYKDHVIIFEDPSSIRRTWLTEEEFLARWHDKDPGTGRKVNHFAMVLKGKKPVARIAPEHMD